MNRSLAAFLSILFHPLLALTYALLVLLWVNPYAFGARSLSDPTAMGFLLKVFFTTVVIPGAGILLLKPLGFIDSLTMPDKQERIGPYIITGVFYLWLFKNFFSLGQTPSLYATCALGAVIGLFLTFFINIFTKISAHAAGMGGLAAMLLLAAAQWGGQVMLPLPGVVLTLSLNVLFALALVPAGLVGTARLALRAHVPVDLYQGYAVGVVGVFIANTILA